MMIRNIALYLRTGLEKEGYKVDQAYDGLMGEKKIMNEHYDLIILDIIMPGVNGLMLL